MKTAHYNDLIAHSGVVLRPGVEALIHAARDTGLMLAIATTTSCPNFSSLITATLGFNALDWFAAICCGEDVAAKKPDPEVYILGLKLCGLAPGQAIAFEDGRNGVRAAKAAGIACIVKPGMYTLDDNFPGSDLIVDNLTAPEAALPQLLKRFG